MKKSQQNRAIDEVRQQAGDTGKLYGLSPVELLVYAAAYELNAQMPDNDAIGVFAEALVNIKEAKPNP